MRRQNGRTIKGDQTLIAVLAHLTRTGRRIVNGGHRLLGGRLERLQHLRVAEQTEEERRRQVRRRRRAARLDVRLVLVVVLRLLGEQLLVVLDGLLLADEHLHGRRAGRLAGPTGRIAKRKQ